MPPIEASARVDGEEQALVLDGVVELLAQDAGLHGHGHVLGVDAQHPVHAADVDADTALHGQQMALQRSPTAHREAETAKAHRG